jgi:hypothetical protein
VDVLREAEQEGTLGMSREGNRNDEAGAPKGAAEDSQPAGASGLPRQLQEHLAQQLRTTYQTMAEKPAFLGDPAVPAEFEHHLQRLEAVERGRQRARIRDKGVEAVRTALEDIATRPPEPKAPAAATGPKRGSG